MNNSVTHTRHHRRHRQTALIVTLVYLAMLCLPLISFALSPPGGNQPKQCVGDCSICGCSPASSAAKTCCCARKLQQQSHAHEAEDDDTPDCCKKEHDEKKETVIACGCPCGTDNHNLVSLSISIEALPSRTLDDFSLVPTTTAFPRHFQNPASRHAEPPEPPPRLV